jgi:hypothetical protein
MSQDKWDEALEYFWDRKFFFHEFWQAAKHAQSLVEIYGNEASLLRRPSGWVVVPSEGMISIMKQKRDIPDEMNSLLEEKLEMQQLERLANLDGYTLMKNEDDEA